MTAIAPFAAATSRLGAFRRRARKMLRDTAGVAMIELGISFPVLLLIGFGALEISNFVMTHTQVSEIALSVADNASRIRTESELALPQVRESDINQIFTAAALQGERLDLENKGLIILSSLEQNDDGGQWIHWQRCFGKKAGESSYGKAGDGETGTSFPGMGEKGGEVTAAPNTAVMFVEIHYTYDPMLFGFIIPDREMTYRGAFNVRDRRDLTRIYNPEPEAAVAECNDYTLGETGQAKSEPMGDALAPQSIEMP